MTSYFVQAFIYLIAAVIAVPLAKRLGLGSVLGYLVAGVIIGPVTGLVGQETATIQHFAEFGVVMMLFLVGMELDPNSLWQMRHKLIGLGGLQVGLTTLVVMGIASVAGQTWSIALTIGLILALSSTAIVLQTLQEKRLSNTEGGRSAFSVLLFQDIAVIPILAFIPLLALPELAALSNTTANHNELSLVTGLPAWIHALVVISAVAFVVIGGHFLSRPLFKFVVNSGLREIFTATALMLVIGIAALMSLVGLSPALGAFLAGVVLANSEFRHELESNIEPFKGLLLGLFFITVGAGISFDMLQQQASTLIIMTLAVIIGKAAILLALAKIFHIKDSNGWLFTLSLAQAGEFGFVLLSYSVQNHVLPAELAQLLSMVVALSMFLTPALFIAFDKLILPRYRQHTNQRTADTIDEQGKVIIAGIGRFGQIVSRLLRANGFSTVVLDHELTQVENVRRVKIKSFFGDASRPDLLHTAGIADARLFVIAIDQREVAIELTRYVKQTYPKVRLLVRAFDRPHYFALKDAGADWIVSETYHSALQLGGEALTSLGIHPFKAEQLKRAFINLEQQHSQQLFAAWKAKGEEKKISHEYTELFLQMEASISAAMQDEPDDRHSRSERGWTPPPKDYIKDLEQEFQRGDIG